MPVTNYHTVNGMLIGETSNGVRRGYLPDALGSVVATVDNDGSIENTYRYKPYGSLLAKTGSAPDPTFLWTGETGSRSSTARHAEQYNRHRTYDHSSSLWLQSDALWPSEQAYVYCNGNPCTFVDPSGFLPECPKGTYDKVRDILCKESPGVNLYEWAKRICSSCGACKCRGFAFRKVQANVTVRSKDPRNNHQYGTPCEVKARMLCNDQDLGAFPDCTPPYHCQKPAPPGKVCWDGIEITKSNHSLPGLRFFEITGNISWYIRVKQVPEFLCVLDPRYC